MLVSRAQGCSLPVAKEQLQKRADGLGRKGNCESAIDELVRRLGENLRRHRYRVGNRNQQFGYISND